MATRRGKRAKSSARVKAKRAKPKRRAVVKKTKARTAKRAPKKSRGATTKSRRAINVPSKAKSELRARLRSRRSDLSSDDQRAAAERMTANLTSTRFFLASRRIACYLPNDGEIDPSLIIERLWRMRKEVFLPVVPSFGRDRLGFARVLPGMKLAPNRYGIAEPRVLARELTRAEDLDLILLPLVAFDANGNRLGRGVGFYDKTLAFRQRRRHLQKPRLLGLAHDFQRVAAVPADAWDVPLDGVVTDRAVYYIN
jgi:5-formyltetrahydrofolate cyclo-ligase